MTKAPNKSQKLNTKQSSIDKGIWEHVTAGVKPLQGNLKNRAPKMEVWSTAQKVVKKKAKSIENVSSHSVNLTRSSLLPELSHGTQTGFDKKNAKKLKRGQHPIEGQLDLHGMTQNQAHTALSHFIQNAFQAGKRCVLVITGKGFKIDGSIGVLRLAVPRWLNEEPNRGRVLAFSYAMPKDGGEGALYIMLKRKR